MADIFISYARSTATQAQQVAEALRESGYSVWRDDELPAHRSYAEVIEERLQAAKVVVVLWSEAAVKSEWVQSEADRARGERKLVQLRMDASALPMPFDRIQCADMTAWNGDRDAPGWRKVVASVAALIGGGAPAAGSGPAAASSPAIRRLSICVLPFANMSGDPEQEYFSDGISEDIITDLSKVSALFVIARNTAFTFKGRSVEAPQIASQLNVSHILEGSVRKAGGRVRITAQLIDGASGGHVWAERYDRELNDIFALQDEISQAIVEALKLRLLPREKRAIERRGTDSVDAYNLFLMARQYRASGNEDARRAEAVARLCARATEIDPNYAAAWALLAWAQTTLRFFIGRTNVDGLAAAERAIALDPDLAEGHAAMANNLYRQSRLDEARQQIDRALRLDPESYEVNTVAGLISFTQGRLNDAICYYEKAAAVLEAAFSAPGMLTMCLSASGDAAGAARAARMTLARVETVLAQDQSNGAALAFGVNALAIIGERERAIDWTRRALLIDPDNWNMRYNLACALSAHLKDGDAAIELLAPYLAQAAENMVDHARIDPDLDPIRADPRFQAMMTAAETRVASNANRAG